MSADISIDEALPDPLVPAEVDLRDFAFMPVDVHRLLNSDTWMLGNGEERAAAMALWLESWHQVPASSVPNNERALQHLSQCSIWRKVRVHVLKGWMLASDGRLYHPVVAEKALEAWLEKLAQRISGGVGNAKRWGIQFETAPIEAQMRTARGLLQTLNPQSRAFTKKRTSGILPGSQPDKKNIGSGSPPDKKNVGSASQEDSPPDSRPESGNDRKREGQGQGELIPEPVGSGGKPRSGTDPVKDEIWRTGRQMLEGQGESRDAAGTFLGKLVKDFGQKLVLDAVRDAARTTPAEAKAWLMARCQERRDAGGNKQTALERRNQESVEQAMRGANG